MSLLDTSSYNGNSKLKASGIEFEWTEERLIEYTKCANDPIYFIKKYVKIVHIDKGVIPFELWPFQEDMIRKSVANRFVIAKMPRQVGKTTTVAALILWYILFHEQFSVAILAHKQKGAHSILSKIKMAYENVPKWMQSGVKAWNGGNIELDNGSKIEASATSSDSIRGGSFSLVYLDELAFVPNNMQEEFFTSTYPVISSAKTSKILITSTPNGFNLFWRLWKKSEEGLNDYVRCDVHWSQVPGRDEKWKEETIRNTSELQFSQEFECNWIGSSQTLISSKVLADLVPSTPETETETIAVHEEPQQNHNYVLVGDVARGAGRDYSTFVVFDITQYPYKIVARYKDNMISHLLFPQYIYEFAKAYNDAFVLVESNDIGQVVSDILWQDFEYENMMMTQSKGRAGQQIGGGYGGTQPVFGVRTTTPVKRIGCANLKSMVESKQLLISDYEVIYELTRFIVHKNSYAAEEGSHDDLVMCCVLFAWLVHQDYFKEIADNDIRATLSKDNERLINDSMLPFGFISDGVEEYVEQEEMVPKQYNYDFMNMI